MLPEKKDPLIRAGLFRQTKYLPSKINLIKKKKTFTSIKKEENSKK